MQVVLAARKQADGNSERTAGSDPLAVGAAGLAHGGTDRGHLGGALLGEREGHLLVVEVGRLAVEHEGEGHDWMERRSPNLRRDELSAERPSDVLAGVGWCPCGRDSTIW